MGRGHSSGELRSRLRMCGVVGQSDNSSMNVAKCLASPRLCLEAECKEPMARSPAVRGMRVWVKIGIWTAQTGNKEMRSTHFYIYVQIDTCICKHIRTCYAPSPGVHFVFYFDEYVRLQCFESFRSRLFCRGVARNPLFALAGQRAPHSHATTSL